jgi:hypothetical protein
MKSIVASVLLAGLLSTFSCLAAAPAGAPAGSTGLCKDGSYYSGSAKKGACRGHKGVKDWWGEATAAKTEATPATGSAVRKSGGQKGPAVAAPGTPGIVWANAATKVYHCPGDRWYGKTKNGKYLTEADAKNNGYKPDHGKACK